MTTDYTPDLTVESAIEAQREALTALRQLVAEKPTIGAMKELSMCAKRYSDMLAQLVLEERLAALETESGQQP